MAQVDEKIIMNVLCNLHTNNRVIHAQIKYIIVNFAD